MKEIRADGAVQYHKNQETITDLKKKSTRNCSEEVLCMHTTPKHSNTNGQQQQNRETDRQTDRQTEKQYMSRSAGSHKYALHNYRLSSWTDVFLKYTTVKQKCNKKH